MILAIAQCKTELKLFETLESDDVVCRRYSISRYSKMKEDQKRYDGIISPSSFYEIEKEYQLSFRLEFII